MRTSIHFVSMPVIWALFLLTGICPGQPIVGGPDRPVDAQTRTAIIQTLLHQLQLQYVFPQVVSTIQQVIQHNVADGAYDQITSSHALADTLTAQMQQISRDKHLRLFYHHQIGSPSANQPETSADEHVAREHYARQTNFGFGQPDYLPGHIGYLRIDEFMDVALAAGTATVAMNTLHQTNALILDLRQNRGGEPDMVAFLASYFFGPDSVHLNDIVRRGGQAIQSFWTLSQLPGKRYAGKPLYILTSSRTFSAGEEFAYDLQSLKRATLVGEPTAGGAHAGEYVRVSDHFTAFIPVEYARNPITHTNWEGTGVKPDLVVSEQQALKKAHMAALETLAGIANTRRKKRELLKLIEQTKATDNPGQ